MSHFPEVITLLSSDEESPSTEEVTPLSAKNEIPIKCKESARKSINTRTDNAAIKSSGLTKQSTSKSNSSLKVINISSVPNSISHLNHINSPTVNAFAKKISQTARKSINSSQSQQNIFSNNSNNVPRKQSPDTKTIILNDKQLLNRNVHCKPVEKHNSIDDKSKGRPIVPKSLINNKAATTSLNRPKKEIPFADKLKERGISISSNTKSDKNSFCVATTKNDKKNIEILTMNPLVNGVCKNIKGNNETLSSHAVSNKNIHNPMKFDKDVSLSWSKKRKLSTNDESKLGSQLIPEPSIHRKMTTNNESTHRSQFKSDLTRKLPTNSGSKLESQSKRELCMDRKLTKNNESRPVGQSKRELSTSIDINAQNKVFSLPSNLNSKTSANEDRLSSSEHIIIVKSDGTAYKTKPSDLDKKLKSLDTDVIYLDPSSSEKTDSANAGSSTNLSNAKNKSESDISTKCASSARFQDDRSLDVMNLLTSEPIPASEKVQQYLSSNSAVSGRQTKEVTSPKLSLKRKRQEDVEILSAAKRGLFSHEANKGCTEKHKDDIVTKHSVPSHKEDPTSSADKDKSIIVNSGLGERSDLQDAKQVLPGPSHETSSVESNTEKFEKFMDFYIKSSALRWDQESQVRSIFSKSIRKASEQFVSSLEFSNLIDTMFAKIREHPRKIYSFMMDFRKQLRDNRSTPTRTPHQTEIESSSQNKNIKDVSSVCSENDYSVVLEQRETTVEMPSQSSSSKNTEQSPKIDSNIKSEKPSYLLANLKLSNEEAQKKIEHNIKKLNQHLTKLDKKLKKLQAKELSLDDLDDEQSTYILEDSYKKRILEIYKKLCKLEGRSDRLKFAMERKYSFNGTRYHEINRTVENFINKSKKVEKFPSYVDIFNLVRRTNESLILGIRESEYSSLARDIFEEVGNELKKRRQKDDEENFGCYLTDDVKLEEDPAERDEELNLKLTKSVIQGEQKLKELIEKYAAKQENDTNADDGSEQDEETANDGSEQDEANADDKSEQVDAEDNALFDPKCNVDDDSLPSTNPATPTTGVPGEPTFPLNSFQKRGINVVTVGSDSDASTDPGPDKKSFNTVSTPAADSDSSCDLPPLNIP